MSENFETRNSLDKMQSSEDLNAMIMNDILSDFNLKVANVTENEGGLRLHFDKNERSFSSNYPNIANFQNGKIDISSTGKVLFPSELASIVTDKEISLYEGIGDKLSKRVDFSDRRNDSIAGKFNDLLNTAEGKMKELYRYLVQQFKKDKDITYWDIVRGTYAKK